MNVSDAAFTTASTLLPTPRMSCAPMVRDEPSEVVTAHRSGLPSMVWM
jgi:hypothetical protein